MQYIKKFAPLLAIIIIVIGFIVVASKQTPTQQELVPKELITFETDNKGNIISRDGEFVDWAQDFLGGTLTTADSLRTELRVLEINNFLDPESYFEIKNQQKVIATLDEVLELLTTQKEEVRALDSRITEIEVDSGDLNTIEDVSIISYLMTLRKYIQTETLDVDYDAKYDELIYGFTQAQELYALISAAGVSRFDELQGEQAMLKDQFMKEITTALGVSLDTIEFPQIPLVYLSWTWFVDTELLYSIVDTGGLADTDKARLGMGPDDLIFELDTLTRNTILESAQKCLSPLALDVMENTTYVQLIPLQRDTVKQVYVSVISEPSVNGYIVDPELLTSGEMIHPWGEELPGFQSTLVNVSDFSCEDVVFAA